MKLINNSADGFLFFVEGTFGVLLISSKGMWNGLVNGQNKISCRNTLRFCSIPEKSEMALEENY